jgi:hypothetical protein
VKLRHRDDCQRDKSVKPTLTLGNQMKSKARPHLGPLPQERENRRPPLESSLSPVSDLVRKSEVS